MSNRSRDPHEADQMFGTDRVRARAPEARPAAPPPPANAPAAPPDPEAAPAALAEVGASAAPAEASSPQVREGPALSLKTWLIKCGRKPDQMVPFARYAQRLKIGPQSAARWELALRAFLDRPV